MKLIPISEHPDHANILYQLLEERPEHANISHRAMPTWEEHQAFVASHPYEAWYVIVDRGPTTRGPGPTWWEGEETWFPVGAIYLTKPGVKGFAGDEIGISVFRDYQLSGYGSRAVMLLIEAHGLRRPLANIAPDNEPSRKMFEKLGFKVVQQTLALEVE